MAEILHKARKAILPSEQAVLSKAVARAADHWNFTNETLGDVIGVSASTASRLRTGSWMLEPKSKPFELAQFFVRLFRSLDSLVGSDDEAAASWLANRNADLDGLPVDQIRTIKGLTDVANYVDDVRARV